ncbi:AMIN domain-containing protein [Maridesulfovibrio frigidus]|uniref:AMIN domain-containing protein n=1 Tax=Maridesulfovibrio frigidus TaxID=340956 RepID=UPI0004E1C21B|nr:AMIN domain-containing protein [Maridesulfovibrio frigidus]
MLTIFYRRFYILLFLIWLSATAGLFVLSVWGDYDTFIDDFSKMVRDEVHTNSTNATAGIEIKGESLNATGSTVLSQASDAIMHKAKVAKNAVRREVVYEVRAVEEGVEDIFDENQPVVDPIAEEVAADKARKAMDRQHSGAGRLTEVMFTETPDKFLAQLRTTKNVERVTFFWLPKPTRLIVDLRGKWKNSASSLYRFSDSFMSHVVVGMHPDRLRVVFEFTDSKAPMGTRPELVRTPEGLDVVVVSPGNGTTKPASQ